MNNMIGVCVCVCVLAEERRKLFLSVWEQRVFVSSWRKRIGKLTHTHTHTHTHMLRFVLSDTAGKV